MVAAVVARRHSGRNVTTAAVDNLVFSGPARANDTVLLIGKITYVGRTSMEVCVRTYIEALNGTRREINIAHLVMVALDEREYPVEVPGLIPATDEEKEAWHAEKAQPAAQGAPRGEVLKRAFTPDPLTPAPGNKSARSAGPVSKIKTLARAAPLGRFQL